MSYILVYNTRYFTKITSPHNNYTSYINSCDTNLKRVNRSTGFSMFMLSQKCEFLTQMYVVKPKYTLIDDVQSALGSRTRLMDITSAQAHHEWAIIIMIWATMLTVRVHESPNPNILFMAQIRIFYLWDKDPQTG